MSSFLTGPDKRKTKECVVFAPTDPPVRVHLHRQQPETPEKDITWWSAGRFAVMDPSFLYPLSFSEKVNHSQAPSISLAVIDWEGV